MSRVDKGAQILVTSLTLSVAVVGFLSLGLAALAPALPLFSLLLRCIALPVSFFLIKKIQNIRASSAEEGFN